MEHRMHKEALIDVASKLFPRFSRFRGFYLVGGTALALHMGHRVSIDFDLFSRESLPPNLLSRVKRVFDDTTVVMSYRVAEQLNVVIDGVKTTFFHFDYPVVDDFIELRGVSIASVREIAAMKAFAIGKRLSYKDYVDWYFLLEEKHITLPGAIAHAKKKFGGDFNDRLFLGQLASFEDVHTQKIDFLRDAVERPTIERFLAKTIRDFKL